MKIFTFEQGSDEWRAARAGIATASEFSSIIAPSNKDGSEKAIRRNYRRELLVERLTGVPKDGFQSAAMKQGTEREPLTRSAYEAEKRVWVDQVGFIRHDEIECGCSPDGLIGEDGGLEIKCPEQSAHTDVLLSRQVPSDYLAQVHGNLALTGRAWWDFCSFNPDFPERMRLVVIRVVADSSYLNLLEQVRSFMEEVKAEEKKLRALYPD